MVPGRLQLIRLYQRHLATILVDELRSLKACRQCNENHEPLFQIYEIQIFCHIFRRYAKAPFTEMIQRGQVLKPPSVTLKDMLDALATCQRTVTDDDLRKFEEFTRKFGIVG